MKADAAMVRGPDAFLGVPVERHPALPSTNDAAFGRAAEGAPEGLVIVAETQTAGRGRHGRAWNDVPGRSLLFSVLLRPVLPMPAWPLLALAMAASVADAGGEMAGAPLRVKWPNDVVCRGRKICGVLAESRGGVRGGMAGGGTAAGGARRRAATAGGGTREVLVIGTGINVGQEISDFPAELKDRATSLRLEARGGPAGPGTGSAARGGALAPDRLLSAILLRFEERLALAREGGAAALFGALRTHLPENGARVSVRVGDRVIAGTVESVLETGALVVREDATGAIETVAAGELA